MTRVTSDDNKTQRNKESFHPDSTSSFPPNKTINDAANRGPHKLSVQQRKHLLLGVKILAGLLIIAAPIFLINHFVQGFYSVSFYGVMAATFGWIAGGRKVGFAVLGALTVSGTIALLLSDHVWLQALLLLALGVLYGLSAGRGVAKAAVQIPILTPYFIMHEPPLFNDPPVINAAYILGVIAVMLLAGSWTILVLHLAVGKRSLTRTPVSDPQMSLVYGTILGLFSALILIISTMNTLTTHWVWMTLTLYLLADPSQLVTPKKMFERTLGTAIGFAIVAVLALIGISDGTLQALAIPALWLCVWSMVIKRPYWQYTLLLTISVVLMNSRGVNTLVLDAERFGYTIIGAILSVFAAFLVNAIYYKRKSIYSPKV